MSDNELEQINKDIDSFIEENRHRIACILSYSVSTEFKPLVITYHKYFTEEVTSKYNAKVFYANNLVSNDLLIFYLILAKESQISEPDSVTKDCRMYVKKFADYNKDVTGGVIALFYNVGNSEKIDEFHQGNKESLKDIQFLNS
jgi:hypothetical protein